MQLLKRVLQSKYLLFVLFLLMLTISYYRVNLEKESIYKGNENVFKLIVDSKKYKDDQYTIVFNGNEKLISYVDVFPYDVGDIIYVSGNLSKPINNTIPNTYNYKMYLQSRGIFWELKIKETKIINRNSNIINKIKNIIYDRISNYKYKEYLYAFLLGNTSYFSNEKRNIYELCGISYLLSIGSIQIIMITWLLKKLEGKYKIKKKHSLIINCIAIIGYIFFTNRVIGVLRSGLCYIITSILKYYKIKYKYQNVIILIGILLLIYNPYYIINIGFLYSFAISIIISLNRNLIKGNYFRKIFMISFIAFIASLPITIYSNYEINLLSIIFSFAFVSIFSFIIFPLSILVYIFSFLSPIFNFFISFIENIIMFLSKIDIFIFVFRKPSMIIILIYYIVILNALYSKKRLLLLLILLLIHKNINSIISEKIITFLDVGEGDSIIIKNNNHLFLLDTGGNIYNSKNDDIIKYIKSLGISKIEYLIISHGDFDHMGWSINIVENFKVEKAIFNCGEYSDLEQKLIKELDKKKIKYYSCIKELNIGKDKLFFIQTKVYDNENDNSNVIYIELNGYKFLFMGDASTTTEKEILNKYNLSDIDVLKVGHHGSRTSSYEEFIDKINPKYSIISVGKNNRYGHPNKEVLDNLKNSKIYRTDQYGSIMFKIKNNKLKIDTCSP